MAETKSSQGSGTKPKKSGGVKGLQAHSRAQSQARGFFVGANARKAKGYERVELTAWKFLRDGKRWTYKRMEGYLLEWLNDNKLLRGGTDMPNFCRLVDAAMMLQLWVAQLHGKGAGTRDAEDQAKIWVQVDKAGESISKCLTKFDMAGALRPERSDSNSEALDEYRTEG